MRLAATLALLLCSAVAHAGEAFLLRLDNGQLVGIAVHDGEIITLTKVTILDPLPPPGPAWKVSGLHLIILDDENQRGKLPRAQLDVFTSKPLRDYLDAHAATAPDGRPAYRFSSNDSLRDGSAGRQLELPVYVQGWDLIMQAVKEGTLDLPAWIAADEKKTILEPLPKDVPTIIQRLDQEFP